MMKDDERMQNMCWGSFNNVLHILWWIKEAYQWFGRQLATITPHLFAMRARSNAIVYWHRWLRDCDLKIVSRNMMHLDGAGTLSPCDRFKTLGFIPVSSVPLVFRPLLHIGHNLLSEKKVEIIRGIFLVCCRQTSLTHSDTSRASKTERQNQQNINADIYACKI